MTVKEVAEICHEANRVICEQNGDYSQKSWQNAEQWQKDSAVTGVKFALANPSAPDSAQHDAWMQDKLKNGWLYGSVKDVDKKTHPCLVGFEQLPEFQQSKDAVFRGIVNSLKKYIKDV